MNSVIMHQPKVSVIVVNWNGYKWLRRFFEFIDSQSYQNYEVIFVDNGSTDNSIKYVRDNHPDCIIVESAVNLGFAGGNNLGIAVASGELVLFINNDTWGDEGLIKGLVTFYLDSHKDVIGAYETGYAEDAIETPYSLRIDPLGHPVYSVNKIGRRDFFISGVCLLFSKELYEKTDGLDENFFMYFEEIDWFWRLHLIGASFAHCPNVYVHHAGGGSTGSGLKYKSFLWRNENTLQMLLKNYKLGTLCVILPIYILQNIAEIIAFTLILKPSIASTYFKGWSFNLRNFSKIMDKRRIVQANRKVSDIVILKSMYPGPAKLSHLIKFTRHRT